MPNANSKKIRFRNARLSYAHLYEAKPFRAGQDPRFSGTFLFDPSSSDCKAALSEDGQPLSEMEWKTGQDAIKLIIGEATRTMKEAYGDKVETREVPKCCGMGDKLDKVPEGYEGMFYVRTYLHEKVGRPIVVNANRQQINKQSDPGAPYSGCYVNGTISLYAQDPKQWGKRLNGNLHTVQFAGDGQAFSGAVNVNIEEEFETLEDGANGTTESDWDIDDNDF
jgi:hypothetical protein